MSEVAGRNWRSAGAGSGLGQGAGDQITGQIADSERPGTGRDAGEGRGRDKVPAGAEAGTGRDAEDQINSKESAL